MKKKFPMKGKGKGSACKDEGKKGKGNPFANRFAKKKAATKKKGRK